MFPMHETSYSSVALGIIGSLSRKLPSPPPPPPPPPIQSPPPLNLPIHLQVKIQGTGGVWSYNSSFIASWGRYQRLCVFYARPVARRWEQTKQSGVAAGEGGGGGGDEWGLSGKSQVKQTHTQNPSAVRLECSEVSFAGF